MPTMRASSAAHKSTARKLAARTAIAGAVLAAAAVGFTAPALAAPADLNGSDPLDQLVAAMPPGYDLAQCESYSDRVAGELAGVDCYATSSAPEAFYLLFEDTDAMIAGAEEVSSYLSIVTCPDGTDNVTEWTLDGRAVGEYTCSINENDEYGVLWTNEDSTVLGYAVGASLDEVFEWWQSVPM
jgi:hypothetical protein